MELEESAEYYNHINKRKIIINLLNETIELVFLKRNFYHLIGLHKITDNRKYGKNPTITSNKALNKILNKDNKVLNEIKGSKDYSTVRNRLYYFNRLYWLILNSKIYKVTPNKNNKSLMDCEFLFVFEINDKTFPVKCKRIVSKKLVLGIQKDNIKNMYIASTFFLADNESEFLQNFLTKQEVSFKSIEVEKYFED